MSSPAGDPQASLAAPRAGRRPGAGSSCRCGHTQPRSQAGTTTATAMQGQAKPGGGGALGDRSRSCASRSSSQRSAPGRISPEASVRNCGRGAKPKGLVPAGNGLSTGQLTRPPLLQTGFSSRAPPPPPALAAWVCGEPGWPRPWRGAASQAPAEPWMPQEPRTQPRGVVHPHRCFGWHPAAVICLRVLQRVHKPTEVPLPFGQARSVA